MRIRKLTFTGVQNILLTSDTEANIGQLGLDFEDAVELSWQFIKNKPFRMVLLLLCYVHKGQHKLDQRLHSEYNDLASHGMIYTYVSGYGEIAPIGKEVIKKYMKDYLK